MRLTCQTKSTKNNKEEILKGTVKRILYQKEGSSFVIFEMMTVDDTRYNCKGFFEGLEEGTYVVVQGNVETTDYGFAIQCSSIRKDIPLDEKSILKYLEVKTKGIGVFTMGKIMTEYGHDALTVIHKDPQKVAKEIKGVNLQMAESMSKSLSDLLEYKDTDYYFTKFGIGKRTAEKIKDYCSEHNLDVKKVLTENPYQLAGEVSGFGFLKADEVGMKAGIKKDSTLRIESGISYVLKEFENMQGDTYVPKSAFFKKAAEILKVDTGLIQKVAKEGSSKFALKGDRIYQAELLRMEQKISKTLIQKANLKLDRAKRASQVETELQKEFESEGIVPDAKQMEAIVSGFSNGALVITGGPGTGKTTTTKLLIKKLQEQGCLIKCVAPTGKAAKRMEEATGEHASTIHRLINAIGDFGSIDADVVIVDEFSMVDVYVMYMLTSHLDKDTSLIMIGDSDQLPSVGAGQVLKDIINSKVIPVVRLASVHRQAEESNIVKNAHEINEGKSVDLENAHKDFFMISKSITDAESVKRTIAILIATVFPKQGIKANDIQVLCPTRKGPLGVVEMNKMLQEALNPKTENNKEYFFHLTKTMFRTGDRILHIKNDYELRFYNQEPDLEEISSQKKKKGSNKADAGVFNGETGIITDILNKKGNVSVKVQLDDGRYVVYTEKELDEIELAYAVTIHKSQGSEYPVVIIPMLRYENALLYNRNLLYTAITRAKKCVVPIGSKQVFWAMSKNTKSQQRFTSLDEMLYLMKKKAETAA